MPPRTRSWCRARAKSSGNKRAQAARAWAPSDRHCGVTAERSTAKRKKDDKEDAKKGAKKGGTKPKVSINLPLGLAEMLFKSLPEDAKFWHQQCFIAAYGERSSGP